MERIEKILLTTDFSDTSRKAFGPAVTLARKFGARILLTYVEEDRLPPLVVEYMAVGVEEILGQQVERAEERLREWVDELGREVEPVDPLVAMGTPHAEIVRLAEEQHADLIVMATHGRGFISHAILGSTAERVLRRAPCPVLIVRDPAAEG
jgi:nucleotide-binding universal stress UspA family protein